MKSNISSGIKRIRIVLGKLHCPGNISLGEIIDICRYPGYVLAGGLMDFLRGIILDEYQYLGIPIVYFAVNREIIAEIDSFARVEYTGVIINGTLMG